MKNLFVSLLVVLCFPAIAQNWELVWYDEFNGSKLDMGKWNYETGNGEGGWGTGQLDYCTSRKENVDVRNGKLVITLREEDYGGFNYTSGRINSRDKYFVKYGKIEARIKVPAGRGIGSAFWMLPQFEKYGWWPRSGEIDIMETNGHEHHINYGTVHYMQWDGHQYKGNEVKTEGDLTTGMHDYTFIWDENSMKWYLDGKFYNEFFIKEPIDGRKPFNEEFFFIISGGIGSNFSGKVIDDKLLPQTYEVDYVRVYKEFDSPVLTFAKTSGSGREIELSFSEELKWLEKFFKDFEIKDQAQILTVTNASMKYRDNHTLVLQLTNPVTKKSELTLSYKGDTIKSIRNQALKKFNNVFIINNSEGASPVLTNAITGKDSYSVELNMSKALAGENPKPEDFILKANGQENKINSAEINKSMPGMIILHASQPLFQSDTIIVSYRGTGLESFDKGTLKPFADVAVSNSLSKKFVVPGKIEAEDYIAELGVMAELCKDEGGEKNLGYIEDNDWMEYEIYVKKAGKYRIEYRASSESAGGVISLKTGNLMLIRTILKPTSSWQTWTTISSDAFELASGMHRIRITAEKGGFNLNWLNFIEE
ncbi:MAG TPA: family 16 glycosylhydrolase [Cytophagaceae bacterium]|nr:family 16 glycosylhydrolase [Cytophagaceae bacterium]